MTTFPVPQPRARRKWRFLLIAMLMALAILGAGIAGFAANGLSTSWRAPSVRVRGQPHAHESSRTLRVFAFNAAKCDFHESGASFARASVVRERLERIGAAIARERPDLVVLSEIVSECGPVDVDQVEVLAEACGFHACVASDNYSFGLPFFRIRSGNAILSKFPLREPSVQQLAGEKPSWRPTNNRRALWCEVDLGGTWWLVGSVRNDSFDAANNELQTLEILSFGGARAALIAGDFNASPDSSSMARIHDSGRFAPTADRRSTFPRVQPTRRIDYVFGPASWRLLAERVVDCGTSDHLAVVSDFRLP